MGFGKKIGFRLIGFMIFFSTLIMLISSAIQVKVNYNRNISEIRARFEALHNSYLPSVTTNIWLLDEERIQTLLDGLGRQPDFLYAGVFSDTGIELARSGVIKSEGVIKTSSDLYYLSRGKNKLVGKFILLANQDGALVRAYQEFWTILATNGFVIIVLAITIYFVVHLLITRHLTKMASYTRQFSMDNINHAFDLARPGEANRKDELHDLVNSFNQMQGRLKNYYTELRILNTELEKRVESRTINLKHEIENHQKTEAELLQQKILFETVIQDVPDALIMVDVGHHIIICNTAFSQIFGYQPEEVIGKKTSFLYSDTSDFDEQGRIRYNADQKDKSEPYIVMYRRKNGEEFPGETLGAIVCDQNDEVHGFLGIVRDITERREMEARLVQSSKMATLGEMSTGMAHEINQPMHVITLAVANIRRKIGSGECDSAYLERKLARISAQTERASAIINHMRVFGRRSDNELRPVVLRQAVAGALNLISEQLRLDQIAVEIDHGDPELVVMGDQVRLEQVILNLIGNARDAIKSGNGEGKIHIRTRYLEDENLVNITVHDTGGGIPKEVIARIFDPFFTTKDVGEGTGLGLSISFGIIEEMRGTIGVSNIDGGAKFEISLPAPENQPIRQDSGKSGTVFSG